VQTGSQAPGPQGTPSGAPGPSGAPSGPRAGVPAGTLMGIGLAEAMASVQGREGQRVGGASLGDGDQRTIQGFPASGSSVPPPAGQPNNTGRRVTQAGMVSEVPGVSPGAVARAPVRAVSSPPSASGPTDSTGSRWQEVPGVSYTGELVDSGSVPQAVLMDARVATPVPPAPRSQHPSPPPQAYHGPRADRFSDAPTQMRDPGAVESRRPRRGGFPWAYVGIAALTALAYFAWLYLLDHL
jgi:hypothetical protein